MIQQERVIGGLFCNISGETSGRDIVLLHGLGCDHTFLDPIAEHFSGRHRVIAPDFPGHGRSSAIPEVTVTNMARGIEQVLQELKSVDALVVGHSMGGNVALELATTAPQLVAGLVMIDSFLWPNASLAANIGALEGLFREGRLDEVLGGLSGSFYLPTDDKAIADRYARSMKATDPASLLSSFVDHAIKHDFDVAAAKLKKPVAYIGAETLLSSFATLASKLPGIKTGQVIGSGHFAPLIVPDQVNAMIERFLAVSLGS